MSCLTLTHVCLFMVSVLVIYYCKTNDHKLRLKLHMQGREKRKGLARRWALWRGGYILEWVPPRVSCWPRPWDCGVGTVSLSGPPLGQGHLCREGRGWLRALSRLQEQAGGGDMGRPPTVSHLPPGSVILFLFCSSPLPCSLPGAPSEGASGLLWPLASS